MALKATVVKAELQLSDLDRHHYATYPLTLAQHPSETDQRLMVRLVAFALFASERLEFGKGLSTDDEPDLWRRDYTGEIELWIDLGQPDESRIRKACGRARQVVVVNYAGRAADLWWDKNTAALSRLGNLTVLDIDEASVDALAAMIERSMRFNALIQDGELQLMGDSGTVALRPRTRLAPAAAAYER
ncbi:YaeQ family protein [Lysobacter sp.]|uniref:YaeQ family protein n=1 Tax=Lysobacter sp. TaxID=72226 RepID=UPI002D5DC768|nr:YaeQ family protein [Lysobacter sp.]HZX76890.1 YaeQ family protein [Lysobacter sp.]